MVRAALYSRYSSDMQRESSIADQERNCRRRAEADSWTVVKTYADAAVSGSDNRRPQYLQMQQAAAEREFDVLLVDDLSRLARDSVEQETVIRRLEYQGIRIIAVSDGYDSAQVGRKIHRGMKGLMNELFLDDLKQKVHRGLTGQAMKGLWCGSRPYGYKLKALRDPNRVNAYGESEQIGTQLVIDEATAPIVREIFQLFADGQSCLAIARTLNDRNVPSPGSTWRRKVRRASGWLGSGVRVILRNPVYRGELRWNTSKLEKHPDTKKRLRRARERSEWITHQDESLRIVSDDLFARAQGRTKALKNGDPRLKSGGKAKYLLSGLLRCEACGSHYVKVNAGSYGCSGYWNGRACDNGVFVRRDALEHEILDPIQNGLLEPKRVERIGVEMQREFDRRMQQRENRAAALPRELQDLDARIDRLRARLAAGDPDMSPADIQAAIDRAVLQRQQMAAAQPDAKQRAKVLGMLPKAAALYRQQIKEGLDGNERAALKARVFLRDLVGPVMLSRGEDGSLWANYKLNPAALLKRVDTCGSGGTDVSVSTQSIRRCVKEAKPSN